MRRTSLARTPCPIARALDQIGEWWSLMIIRDAFLGVTRFEAFQESLGISRNALTARLGKLVKAGVLERRPVAEGARRKEYKLTAKGKDLFTTVMALRQWGERWTFKEGALPHVVVEREGGAIVPRVEVRASDGRPLTHRDTALKLK
jgi:DNA-binding HxlR family transcriptional regulator